MSQPPLIAATTLLTLICVLTVPPAVSLFADGIPVDPETGEISASHSIVKLSEEQIEEVESLGTLTLTKNQWEMLRKVAPACSKRLNCILPVTWNDCTCGVDESYGIAVARDQVAILHESWDESDLSWNLWNEGIKEGLLYLRIDQRGQFYYRGALVPFQKLLEAIGTRPEFFKEAVLAKDREGEKPFLYVRCPFGMDRGAVTLKSRIDRLYETAGSVGWDTPDSDA